MTPRPTVSSQTWHEQDAGQPGSDKDFLNPRHVTVIEPPNGWRMVDVRELWAYRELLWALTVRDLKVRYKQTALGAAWAIIQPAGMMIVFSMIFGALAGMPSDGYPYPLFVYAGLVPWTFFASAVSASGGSLVGSAHLVTKIYFPRLIIPLTSVGVSLVDFAFSTAVLLLLMLYYDTGWSTSLLATPVLLLGVVFTAVGVGTLLSALTVAHRDFRHVVPFLLQVWLFATPVVYPMSLVPGQWHWVLYLNPMTSLIEGFRAPFLGKALNIEALGASLAVSALIFSTGVVYFEKVERRFADVI